MGPHGLKPAEPSNDPSSLNGFTFSFAGFIRLCTQRVESGIAGDHFFHLPHRAQVPGLRRRRMKTSYKNSISVFLSAVLVTGAVLAAGTLTGCATSSERETTYSATTETTGPQSSGETVQQTQTETNTETHEETTESRGILSSTVHFIGAVIAFPFKLIGGVIQAIF
jgi:hypothetical protein